MGEQMSIDFEWKRYVDRDGIETPDPQPCDMCGADVPVYEFKYKIGCRHAGDPRYLCELCASTPAGNAQEYPDQYGHEARCVMATVNHSANAVLLQLGKWPERPLKRSVLK